MTNKFVESGRRIRDRAKREPVVEPRTVQEALEAFDSLRHAAQEIGTTYARVRHWYDRNGVPASSQARFRRALKRQGVRWPPRRVDAHNAQA